ncbi:hypothetical protein PR048_008646 [Dryococelus australis]|uniref:GAG-pre-integrase domain-containing protein n=1 Tax=Dryococelus australis TaxID=614101 RepID=A0ABQ9HXN9_9NEOP|nr:hypothetical protein PR048_008646 [Dryococelus australis]
MRKGEEYGYTEAGQIEAVTRYSLRGHNDNPSTGSLLHHIKGQETKDMQRNVTEVKLAWNLYCPHLAKKATVYSRRKREDNRSHSAEELHMCNTVVSGLLTEYCLRVCKYARVRRHTEPTAFLRTLSLNSVVIGKHRWRPNYQLNEISNVGIIPISDYTTPTTKERSIVTNDTEAFDDCREATNSLAVSSRKALPTHSFLAFYCASADVPADILPLQCDMSLCKGNYYDGWARTGILRLGSCQLVATRWRAAPGAATAVVIGPVHFLTAARHWENILIDAIHINTYRPAVAKRMYRLLLTALDGSQLLHHVGTPRLHGPLLTVRFLLLHPALQPFSGRTLYICLQTVPLLGRCFPHLPCFPQYLLQLQHVICSTPAITNFPSAHLKFIQLTMQVCEDAKKTCCSGLSMLSSSSLGSVVSERLYCLPPTMANRFQYLVNTFAREYPVSPTLALQCAPFSPQFTLLGSKTIVKLDIQPVYSMAVAENLWHRRLGHLHRRNMNILKNMASGAESLQVSSETKTKNAKIPGRVTPDFCLWESCRMMPLADWFCWGYPVSSALSFWRCSILTSITLIGSQDLDVKNHPNLFSHSLKNAKECPQLPYISWNRKLDDLKFIRGGADDFTRTCPRNVTIGLIIRRKYIYRAIRVDICIWLWQGIVSFAPLIPRREPFAMPVTCQVILHLLRFRIHLKQFLWFAILTETKETYPTVTASRWIVNFNIDIQETDGLQPAVRNLEACLPAWRVGVGGRLSRMSGEVLSGSRKMHPPHSNAISQLNTSWKSPGLHTGVVRDCKWATHENYFWENSKLRWSLTLRVTTKKKKCWHTLNHCFGDLLPCWRRDSGTVHNVVHRPTGYRLRNIYQIIASGTITGRAEVTNIIGEEI